MNTQGDIRKMRALQGHFIGVRVDVDCSLEEQVEIGDDKHFFTAAREVPSYESGEPWVVPHKTNWRRQQGTVYWFDLQLAQSKGLVFWQMISNVMFINDSMPADCLVQVIERGTREAPYQKPQPESQNTPKDVWRANWQREWISIGEPNESGSSTDKISAEKPDATSLTLVPTVNTRTPGVSQNQTNQQDDRQKLISTLVRTILSDPDKDKLIRELQESRCNE